MSWSWPPGPPGSGRTSSPRRSKIPEAPAPGVAATTATGDAGAVTPRGPSGIALLVPGGLRGIGGFAIADVAQLVAVLHQAVVHQVRQVWIGPQMIALQNLGVPGPSSWLAGALRDGWTTSSGRAELAPWTELLGNPRYPSARVELVFPSWDPDGNPFSGAGTAAEVLQALELFTRQLGLRYRWSPAQTGLALMRAVHQGRGGIELPVQGTPAPVAIEHRGALDSWTVRSWTANIEELAGKGWLHAWDINGMYLAAASSAELPFGEPVRARAWIGHVGYARASIAPRDIRVEPPFKVDGKPHWYTTSALAYLTELGYRPRVGSSWIYPEHRRWLEPWYERLRDARTALMAAEGPGGALALGAVKRVYTASLGRLAGSWLPAGDPTFRPDWRHVVIDRARINLHRHLMSAGRPPCAIDEDLVVWPSSTLDPIAAAQELRLQVSPQLGKWKWQGRAQVAVLAPRLAGAGKSTRKRLDAILELLERSA